MKISFFIFTLLVFFQHSSGLSQAPNPEIQGLVSSMDRADWLALNDMKFFRMEIRANTFAPSRQGSTNLAMDKEGGFIVVWDSKRQESGSYGVYAQRFSSIGKRIGEEVHVNQTLQATQWRPTLGLNPQGTTWIAWESSGQEGCLSDCLVRRFDGHLCPKSDEVRLSQRGEGNSMGLTLMVREDGAFIAAWTDRVGKNPRNKAFVCLFSKEGKKEGRPVLIDDRGDHQELWICSAPRKDNGFVVAWAGLDADSKPAGIWARLFRPDGTPVSPPFKVNEKHDRGSIEPGLDVSPDDGFVVTWMQNRGGDRHYEVMARRFGPMGRAKSPAFQVSPKGEGHKSGACVAVSKEGGFCVAWNSFDGACKDSDIHAQLFDETGQRKGPVFLVNRHNEGNQALPAHPQRKCVAYGPQGQLAFAWAGNSDLEDKSAANVTLLIPWAGGMKGDLNEDGQVDLKDRAAFLSVLLGENKNPLHYAAADLNRDGFLNEGDMEVYSLLRGDLFEKEEDRKRWDARKVSLHKAFLMVEREKENKRVAMEKARSKNPELVMKKEEAVPHELPLQGKSIGSVGPYGGDPDPFSWRGDFGFLGITYKTGWIPPDPHLAVGPDYLVAIANGVIVFFEKDGTLVFEDELYGSNGFWGELGATYIVFDPEVIYDPHSNRFMAMACERTEASGQGSSYFLLAVSDDSDPNGIWYKYRLNVTGLGGGGDIDSPNLAVDEAVLYLTADFFTGGPKYLICIFEKDPLLSGGSPTMANHLLITGTQSYGIPVMYDEAPGMYMIEHYESYLGNDKVRLHAITDPLGNPQHQTFQLTVPMYFPPEDAPQMGSTIRMNTFDARFWSTVYRNGSLWAAHHQGAEKVQARWYEIDMMDWPNTGNPCLVQSGDIHCGDHQRTYFNSISVDDYGNALMCFARSSPVEYISIARAYRAADDPLNTMRPMEIIKESPGPYTIYRWGDYSAVGVDPEDHATFWYHHEYSPIPNSMAWNTWIASRRIQPMPLTVDVSTLSESSGGTATFTLTNPSHGDKYYLLLGTLSGTSPGFPLPPTPGGVIMPINWDDFTTLIVNNLGPPYFDGFLGQLDHQGEATAVFWAPSLPNLAGFTLDFAYCQDGQYWDFASNNVSILIEP